MINRLKHLGMAALVAVCASLVACTGGNTSKKADAADSTHTKLYISKISLREPERALAIIDTMEMNKELSSSDINYMRLMVYNNGLCDYKMSEYYASQVLKDSVWLKKNPEQHCMLEILISDFARQNGRYTKCLKYAEQAVETARRYKNKMYELSAQAAVAHSLTALGDVESAFKIFAGVKDEVMRECGESTDFNTLNNAFTFIGDYFELLMENKRYKEAELLIPDFVKVNDNIGKVGSFIDGAVEYRQLHTYSMLMQYYDYCGKKEESAKYKAMIVKSSLADTEFVQIMLCKHYFIVKDNDKLAEIVSALRQKLGTSNDTISKFFIDNVLKYEKYLCVAKGNYRKALEKQEAICNVQDSVSRQEQEADGRRLAKIYETQEKERLLIEKDAQLSRHQNIFIGLTVMMVLGLAFIVVLLLFNRKVNRRNKTIVATINQMMEKEDELMRLRLTGNNGAKNVNPDEMRLMQSLEMLKDDKDIEEIATSCGFRNTRAFGKKFFEYFGIQVDEYRKWSKNISNQEKASSDEAIHMKDSFIKNMSHEIRTPLNQIFGFVQLLTDPSIQLSDDEKRQYNDIIGSQTTYMTQMLNKFLAMSEYESSDAHLPKETIAIEELMNNVMAHVPSPKDGVEMNFSNKSGMKTIESNYKGLATIMESVVGNAVKFTDSGSINIECAVNADGNTIFTVTDTGKGIPEGEEERIFERFHKVDEFVPGAGLGLSLAREIAGRMDATVTLDRSNSSQGSTFVVTLK